MRRSLAILSSTAARPDIRAAVAAASLVASGAVTWWWCARNRRRDMAVLLATLRTRAGREGLAAIRRALSGVHKSRVRGWLGPPEAAAQPGMIVATPGFEVRRRAREWYYRLAPGASSAGALTIGFDGEGRVRSVDLLERQ